MITEDLLIRSLQGRATAEEERRIRRWRASASENEEQYRALLELWTLLDAAAPDHPAFPGSPVLQRVLARAEGEATSARGDSRSPEGGRVAAPKGSRMFSRGRALAAGLLAACVGIVGFGLGSHLGRSVSEDSLTPFSEVITGEAERTTVMLYDGTAVRLGPKSTLRVMEAGAAPVLWVSGRAYVGVVPDSSRVVTVRTAFGEAVAVGTRFEVRTDEEEFRVLVVEGNVRVSAAGASIQMGEGLMSRSADGAPPSSSRVADMYEQLDWVGSILVFRGTPLTRVIAEIERKFGVVVVLEDPSLRDVTITATFTDQQVDDVVHVVCQILRASCASEDRAYRIGADTPDSPRSSASLSLP